MHPKYIDMITGAIGTLKERNGSSRQAIMKYVLANYKVTPENCGTHLKLALKRGVISGALVQIKGTGASGSFKLAKPAPKPKVKKPAAKKPAAKKPAAKKTTPAKKKPAAKKNTAKKPQQRRSPPRKQLLPRNPLPKKLIRSQLQRNQQLRRQQRKPQPKRRHQQRNKSHLFWTLQRLFL